MARGSQDAGSRSPNLRRNIFFFAKCELTSFSFSEFVIKEYIDVVVGGDLECAAENGIVPLLDKFGRKRYELDCVCVFVCVCLCMCVVFCMYSVAPHESEARAHFTIFSGCDELMINQLLSMNYVLDPSVYSNFFFFTQ